MTLSVQQSGQRKKSKEPREVQNLQKKTGIYAGKTLRELYLNCRCAVRETWKMADLG